MQFIHVYKHTAYTVYAIHTILCHSLVQDSRKYYTGTNMYKVLTGKNGKQSYVFAVTYCSVPAWVVQEWEVVSYQWVCSPAWQTVGGHEWVEWRECRQGWSVCVRCEGVGEIGWGPQKVVTSFYMNQHIQHMHAECKYHTYTHNTHTHTPSLHSKTVLSPSLLLIFAWLFLLLACWEALLCVWWWLSKNHALVLASSSSWTGRTSCSRSLTTRLLTL